MQGFAVADCKTAIYQETGLKLSKIKENNITLGEEATLGKYPVGDGGIYAYKKSVNFMGQLSELTMGMYMVEKASAISLGFNKEIDHVAFSKKHKLDIKKINDKSILFSCEKGISLAIQEINGMYAVVLKSIAEVDILTATNRPL